MNRKAVLALTCVPAFMVALDALVVTVALATIRRDLHASMGELSWTVNAYVIAFGVLILLGAVLGDRLGRRRMFRFGLLLFSGASAAAALAPSPGLLIAARAFQGAGAAVIAPLSLALVTASFPAGARGKVIGLWGAASGSAVALGPIVGGAVVQGVSWAWIFWLNVPIGLAAAMLAPRLLAESHGTKRALDPAGVVLVTAGFLALIWGLVRGNQDGWGSVEIVTALVCGALLLIAFLGWQLRAPSPLLPRHLLTNRSALAANCASFLLTAALFGAAFLVPQYLQSALHHSPLGTGLRLLPWTAVTLVVIPLAGAVSDRIGNRTLVVAGLLLQAIGFAWIAVVAHPAVGYGALIVPLLAAGVGVSLVMPAVANAVVGGVTPQELGLASATNTAFRQLGAPFGVAVVTAVFQQAGGFTSPQAFTDGLTAALAVAAAMSVAGAVVGLRVAGRPRAPRVAKVAASSAAA